MTTSKKKTAPSRTVSIRLSAEDYAKLSAKAEQDSLGITGFVSNAVHKRVSESGFPCAAAMARLIQLIARIEAKGSADPELIAELDRTVDRLVDPTLAERQ